jgi:hypothetical protein
MNAIKKKWHVVAMAAGAAATLVVVGCSGDDSGLARRYKVTGTVKYKGELVPKATIVFEPANPPIPQGRHANGHVENGSYTLSTAGQDDGALPGEYKVMVMSTTLDVTELGKKHGGLLHQGDAEHQKAAKEAKNPLPAKYAQSANTPLKAKVEANNSNRLDFNLED